jgi:hypothetical protein
VPLARIEQPADAMEQELLAARPWFEAALI